MKPIFGDSNWIGINRRPIHQQNPMVVSHGKSKTGVTCEKCVYLHESYTGELYVCTVDNRYFKTKNFCACGLFKQKGKEQ